MSFPNTGSVTTFFVVAVFFVAAALFLAIDLLMAASSKPPRLLYPAALSFAMFSGLFAVAFVACLCWILCFAMMVFAVLCWCSALLFAKAAMFRSAALSRALISPLNFLDLTEATVLAAFLEP